MVDRWRCVRAQTGSGSSLYTNFGVAAPDGLVWGSVVPMRSPVRVNDRPYFIRAIDAGETVLGGFQIGRLAGLPSIVGASPIPRAFYARGVAFTILRTSGERQLS